jgi:hypothetical protein
MRRESLRTMTTAQKRTMKDKHLKWLFWGTLAALFLFQATIGSIARKME